MSETQPSPEPNGDTNRKHCDATIFSRLGIGQRILVDDRARPLKVREVRTRQPELVDGDTEQTVVVASGRWKGAADIELREEIHIRGEPTGAIVDPNGREHEVRLAPPSEPADFGGGDSTGAQDL